MLLHLGIYLLCKLCLLLQTLFLAVHGLQDYASVIVHACSIFCLCPYHGFFGFLGQFLVIYVVLVCFLDTIFHHILLQAFTHGIRQHLCHLGVGHLHRYGGYARFGVHIGNDAFLQGFQHGRLFLCEVGVADGVYFRFFHGICEEIFFPFLKGRFGLVFPRKVIIKCEAMNQCVCLLILYRLLGSDRYVEQLGKEWRAAAYLGEQRDVQCIAAGVKRQVAHTQ